MSHSSVNKVVESYQNENENGNENGNNINEEDSLISGIPNIITYFSMGVGAIIIFFTLAYSSLLLFPASATTWFGQGEGFEWLQEISLALGPGQPLYVILFSALIAFFCFFYTALVFNPKETADNLKKSGAFIPGIRPGDQTAKHIEKIMLRLTMVGAIYVTLVCLLPEFLILKWNVPFYFGGTSLLIIVVVTMDFMSQIQAYMQSHQYDSLLKKSNFKGGGGLSTR